MKKPCLSIIDCGPVPSLDNGAFILYNVSNTTYGAAAEVVCNTGHNASDANITCMEHGLWSNVTCEPVGKKSYSVKKLFYNVLTAFQ